MKINTVLSILALAPLYANALDQPVNTENRQSSSTSAGSEKKSDRSRSSSSKQVISVTSEIGVGALFRWKLDALERINRIFTHGTCSVFNSKNVVYTDSDGRKNFIRNGAPKYEGGAPRLLIDAQRVFGSDDSTKYIGIVDVPANRLLCHQRYADLVALSAQALIKKTIQRPGVDMSGTAVHIVPNLQETASKVFDDVYDDVFRKKISITAEPYDGKCFIPTAQGVQEGINEVMCGQWSFNARGGNMTFTNGGVKWLDQDYVHGKKILFAEANSDEIQAQLQESRSDFSKKESSTQRAKSRTSVVAP